MAGDNAALARTLYDHFNRGDLKAAMDLAAEDIEVELLALGQTFKGRDGFM